MRLALSILGWVLVGLSAPAVIELSLFLFANLVLRRQAGKVDEAHCAVAIDSIAVLIPAHDEEKDIARCVASVLASDSGPYGREVVVIADNCTDRTAELAREAGARVIERFDESLLGKGAALRYAIESMRGEANQAFVVIDADSVVDPNFIRAMGDHFASGKEAVQCVYLVLNSEASPRTRLMNLALLSMNAFRPAGRESLGCSVGIMGNGFGLSRKLLEDVPYAADSITEDLEYHLRLIDAGRRVRFALDTRVLADFPVSGEGSRTQRARWEGGRLSLQRRLLPGMVAKLLSGRVEQLEPILELATLPLSYEVLVLIALMALPGAFFSAYAIFGVGAIASHIVAAILLYGRREDFKALLEVPRYVVWKIGRMPRILSASAKHARWVRTRRD